MSTQPACSAERSVEQWEKPGFAAGLSIGVALEDYPFRVEKMGPRGEIGHVVCYTDNIAVARATESLGGAACICRDELFALEAAS